MQRLLLSALSAGLLTIACGAGDPNIVSPSSASASPSPSEPGSGSVNKFYTIGGVVMSTKPALPVGDANIAITYSSGFEVKDIAAVDGHFAMAVLPGVLTLTVSKKGYEPWSERIEVYKSIADLRPQLTPIQ
jgi:hypothetical protein